LAAKAIHLKLDSAHKAETGIVDVVPPGKPLGDGGEA